MNKLKTRIAAFYDHNLRVPALQLVARHMITLISGSLVALEKPFHEPSVEGISISMKMISLGANEGIRLSHPSEDLANGKL